MDTTFPTEYECDQLMELPNGPMPHFYYPDSNGGGADGLLVMVRPKLAQTWIGTFAFGRVTPKGVSGIYSTPNPRRVCVVANGSGYLVSTNVPKIWESIWATPITDVRPIRAQGIIVFATFTDLVAYDGDNVKWRTKRLTWSDMKIVEATDSHIKGEYWDIRIDRTGTFVVDLRTGAHEGGIEAF